MWRNKYATNLSNVETGNREVGEVKSVGMFVFFFNCRRISYLSSKCLYVISENGSDNE